MNKLQRLKMLQAKVTVFTVLAKVVAFQPLRGILANKRRAAINNLNRYWAIV